MNHSISKAIEVIRTRKNENKIKQTSINEITTETIKIIYDGH